MNEIKFIPGKYYKTRGGAKARFVGELIHTDSNYPLTFELDRVFHWTDSHHRIDGSIFENQQNGNDIVSEWCGHDLHITLPNGDIHCAHCNEELNVLSRLYKKHESTKDKDAHRGMACLVMNCAACESKEKPREDCRCDKDCKCDIDSDCNCWCLKENNNKKWAYEGILRLGYKLNELESSIKGIEDYIKRNKFIGHKDGCSDFMIKDVSICECLKEKPKKIERLYGSNEWKTLTEKCLVDTINELIDAINKLKDK